MYSLIFQNLYSSSYTVPSNIEPVKTSFFNLMSISVENLKISLARLTSKFLFSALTSLHIHCSVGTHHVGISFLIFVIFIKKSENHCPEKLISRIRLSTLLSLFIQYNVFGTHRNASFQFLSISAKNLKIAARKSYFENQIFDNSIPIYTIIFNIYYNTFKCHFSFFVIFIENSENQKIPFSEF